VKYFRLLISIFLILTAVLNAQEYKRYLAQGDSLYKNFKIDEAFKYYEKAFELNPESYTSLLNIVKSYNAIGELKRKEHKQDEAKEDFNKAINYSERMKSLYPDSSQSYTYAAVSYGNMARFTGGKERLNYAKKIETNAKKAIQLDSNNAIPYIILGAFYREIARLSWIERIFANMLYGSVPDGSVEDSEKMLKKALDINPDIITANFQMALTYRSLKDEEKEKEYFKKVLSLPLFDFRDPYLKQSAQRFLKRINENKS
jgi:tetratricopeptide (TPR) repeat protein